jgi:hypothetical protein
MASPQLNEVHMKHAAEAICATHGGLRDLPRELANSVGNVYYRFVLCVAVMSTHLSPDSLRPFGQHIRGAEGFPKLLAFCTYAGTRLQLLMTLLPALRSRTDEADFNVLCGVLLDTFKYNIGSATQKSSLRRSIERAASQPREITNLIELMAREVPEILGPPKVAPVDLPSYPNYDPKKYVPSNKIPSVSAMIGHGMSPDSARAWRGMNENLESAWLFLVHVARLANIEVVDRAPGYIPRIDT